MRKEDKPVHFLSLMHLLAIAALLVWWSFYFWHHSPVRQVLGSSTRPAATSHESASLSDAVTRRVGGMAERASSALLAALVDVVGGLVVLVLFAVASGIYVRRLEIWLQARGSGAAMAVAGGGLSDRALAANKDRDGSAR